jgi:phage terminase large subunit
VIRLVGPEKFRLAAAQENPFLEFQRRYYNDPVLFVREVFGAEPDEKQQQLLRGIAARKRRIAFRSGHGVGKTTVIAWALVWWILTRFPQKAVCTAPTSGQLYDALAAETKAWIGKLPPLLKDLLEIKSERIELKAAPHESFIAFNTSRAEKPEAMAGVHSDNVLLVGDEASGIPEPVYEAAAGSMSGHTATTVLTGNPVRTTGLFSDVFNKPELKDEWLKIHSSCVNHPRISPDFVRDMKLRYGEESNAYRVRVLGEFPKADDDTIIPFELMQMSLTRDVKATNVKPIWGVDVARFGSDKSALAKRQGNVLLEPVKEWAGLDTMQVVGRVVAEWFATPASMRPETIVVDSIGLGAGVVDRLIELKLPARGVNVSESPALKEKFRNLRAELWFEAREWFTRRDCSLGNDAKLGNELIMVRYKIADSSGKLQAESKDDMKKRGFPSPNLADAFVLTFAEQAVSALHGSKSSTRWNQPLRRNVGGIV